MDIDLVIMLTTILFFALSLLVYFKVRSWVKKGKEHMEDEEVDVVIILHLEPSAADLVPVDVESDQAEARRQNANWN